MSAAESKWDSAMTSVLKSPEDSESDEDSTSSRASQGASDGLSTGGSHPPVASSGDDAVNCDDTGCVHLTCCHKRYSEAAAQNKAPDVVGRYHADYLFAKWAQFEENEREARSLVANFRETLQALVDCRGVGRNGLSQSDAAYMFKVFESRGSLQLLSVNTAEKSSQRFGNFCSET